MTWNNFNQNQILAIKTIDCPLLVIAGAGTGKTTVLTSRIIYLIEDLSINPDRILALTFTKKAADEMLSRITKQIHTTKYFNWIGTYHSICLKILKEDITYLGWSTNFTIIDDDDQKALIKKIIKDYHFNTKLTSKKIAHCIEQIKFDDNSYNDYPISQLIQNWNVPTENDANIIIQIYQIYTKILKNDNQLDFSDLINFTHKLLSTNYEICKKWQNRFDHILIDEFQDTNKKQFEIINFIAQNTKNIFVVGDPNQTIYTWRGAYPEIFDNFCNTYKNTKIIKMSINYRSTKNILIASNELISNNKNNFKNDLIPTINNNSMPKVFIGNCVDSEANYICSSIKKIVNRNIVKYNEILILYRANYCSKNIEEKLIDNNIPYIIFGSINFYSRKEIKDLISYLKMLFCPNDISALRIINVPRRSIGIDTINKISQWAIRNNKSFVNCLNEIEDIDCINNATKLKIRNFLNDLNDLKNKINDKGWESSIPIIVNHIKYVDWLKQTETEISERIENIDELAKAIYEYKFKHQNSTINDFLNEINLYTIAEKTKINNDCCVHLMTIHMAKGKEYNTVFLFNFNEGVIPSPNSLLVTNGIDEERRIVYVAMTRAKQSLHITCSNNKNYISFYQQNSSPSRFLNDFHTYERTFENFTKISNKDLEWFDSSKISNEKVDMYTNTYKFKNGDIIVHTIFGSGVVTNVNGDMIDVIFKKPYGKKILNGKHNSIKRIVS